MQKDEGLWLEGQSKQTLGKAALEIVLTFDSDSLLLRIQPKEQAQDVNSKNPLRHQRQRCFLPAPSLAGVQPRLQGTAEEEIDDVLRRWAPVSGWFSKQTRKSTCMYVSGTWGGSMLFNLHSSPMVLSPSLCY